MLSKAGIMNPQSIADRNPQSVGVPGLSPCKYRNFRLTIILDSKIKYISHNVFVLVPHPEVGARLLGQKAAWMRVVCLTA